MSEEIEEINNQLVLIAGESSTGKSASLINIRDQNDWVYLNTEAGKRLPFKNKFETYRIADPLDIPEAFDYAHGNPSNKGIIVDSLTFMMDMFETQYVLAASDTRTAWGDYQQFFKDLMQKRVAQFDKPTIFTAHTKSEYDEASQSFRTSVPIKGALKGNGIEAYFSTIVSTKKVSLAELAPYKDNGLLSITEDDEILGYKHVFQTRPTKATVGERIRSPMGMFDRSQTYMDNDAQLLLDHLHKFYN